MKAGSYPSKFGVLCSKFNILNMKHLLIVLVRIYQKTIGRIKPACCRFYPTCSDYTIEALRRHGIVAGLVLSLRRICRCHPWNPGGVDFVPKPRGQRIKNRDQKSI